MIAATGEQLRWELVGRVMKLYRYPVKSMAGERLEEARLGWHGLAGDRRCAFLRLDSRSGLPWLSARDFPGLLCYRAHYADSKDLSFGRPIVITPGGSGTSRCRNRWHHSSTSINDYNSPTRRTCQTSHLTMRIIANGTEFPSDHKYVILKSANHATCTR